MQRFNFSRNVTSKGLPGVISGSYLVALLLGPLEGQRMLEICRLLIRLSKTISYGTRTRPRSSKINFFHMLWLVLVLVLVRFCGLCQQKRGTRPPRSKKIGGQMDEVWTRQ
jgi:hypothetical protein